MALASENLTLQQIAREARLPARSLSTLVGRLVDGGFVVPVDPKGG